MDQPGSAGSAPSGRPSQSSRSRRWWLSGTKEWLGLLSAILGLAVAVLGVVAYNTGQSRDQAQQATARLKTENSQLQEEIDATNARVKRLNAALDQAQRTLKSATSTPSPTSSAPGQEVSQKTGVQLTDCHALSFTDPSLHPYQVPGCSGFPTGDLSIDAYGEVQSVAQAAIYSGRAGFSQCQADTTYIAAGAVVNLNNLRLTDSTLCVTTANSIAACYVTYDTTSASVPAPGLTMDVTIYALK